MSKAPHKHPVHHLSGMRFGQGILQQVLLRCMAHHRQASPVKVVVKKTEVHLSLAWPEEIVKMELEVRVPEHHI